MSSASRPTRQGRFAIVTNVGRGMRWTRAALLTRALSCGRRSRVVLTPRRWRQASQKCLRGDGGKKARSPGRARNKLLKPLRAGMPGDPGATVVTTLVCFLPLRTRLRVQRAPGIPHALIGAQGFSCNNSGARASRDRECMFDECARHTLCRRRRLVVEQRCASHKQLLDCFAEPCHHALAVKTAWRGILSPSVHIATAARPPWSGRSECRRRCLVGPLSHAVRTGVHRAPEHCAGG
jgi:hypothetical protein